MKKALLLSLSVALFAVGCKNEDTEKPKVTYKARESKAVAAAADSSEIEIADLPIQISGTSYLIHPVGQYRVMDGARKSGYSYEKGSFTVSNYGEFEITGYLKNLKIQEVSSDSIKAVFDKPVLIQTATFLKAFADKTKQQILVYSLSDMDTNQDGKLDASDIRTLYIGEINGNKLVKVSPDFQELIDWNFIESKNRLYFRTIEDTNKSGEFDKNDVLHYNYIDLLSADWKVVEYKPV
ncbi:hypothetical protein HUK80_14200 [Flavobacterium sp. MAH-1]|uniref:EF-hand domain-containing protein n=1 Tax=Flavobacterium agri TaxID=2743471 RepID=A0A7Y9C854_9FLAO|nr:hypothetical protein [Flavobacterium agri]NUY82053.1 hypothetical protein [Flavobacterium agri]NYA72077.1 hypothetical protein [Flavobacterium agri]